MAESNGKYPPEHDLLQKGFRDDLILATKGLTVTQSLLLEHREIPPSIIGRMSPPELFTKMNKNETCVQFYVDLEPKPHFTERQGQLATYSATLAIGVQPKRPRYQLLGRNRRGQFLGESNPVPELIVEVDSHSNNVYTSVAYKSLGEVIDAMYPFDDMYPDEDHQSGSVRRDQRRIIRADPDLKSDAKRAAARDNGLHKTSPDVLIGLGHILSKFTATRP